MVNDVKDVRTALAKALAGHQVDDQVIERAAIQLAKLPKKIRGLDICQYGICLDLFLDGEDWRVSVRELLALEEHQWERFQVLIHGIPVPDFARVELGERFPGIPSVRGLQRG